MSGKRSATILGRTFLQEIRMERKEASDVLWNGGELKRTFSEEMQSIQMERESVVKEKERLTEERQSLCFLNWSKKL